MNNFWDNRYNRTEYVYGETPNLFFQEQMKAYEPGSILLPAEGEGRNAVYAATKGWEVYAFDQSVQAKNKALQLAEKNKVSISYQVGDFSSIIPTYAKESFDLIAIIFLHVPPTLSEPYFKSLLPLLKPGGHIIFEGFSKGHVKYQQENSSVGGPGHPDMLYRLEQIRHIFSETTIEYVAEEEVTLSEGVGHNGKGKVIRMVARKRPTHD